MPILTRYGTPEDKIKDGTLSALAVDEVTPRRSTDEALA